MHGKFLPHGNLLKRLNSRLNIMFLKNKLHCDNHCTMYSMILKYNISCHMHFKMKTFEICKLLIGLQGKSGKWDGYCMAGWPRLR